MASLPNLNGVSETLPLKLSGSNVQRAGRRATIVPVGGNKTEKLHENQLRFLECSVATTRRAVLGLAAISLSVPFGIEKTLAEDNGYWITGPIPIPPIYNNIANKETGTRSFIHHGSFVPDIGPKGSVYRLKKYAFDLMGMGDLIQQNDAFNYVRRYLRQKSTVMYYDFDKIITAAPAENKQPFTDLANRLFDNFEKLEQASKRKSLPQTESCYQDTTNLLQEVMNVVAL